MTAANALRQHIPGGERRSQRGSDPGQALAEFALIVPLILVLLFAVIDFGRAYACYVTLTNATREGARLGITGATSAQIIARTQTTATNYNDAHLTVTVTNAQGTSGSDVTVQAQYTLPFITPLGSLIQLLPGGGSIGSSITLSVSTVMRIE